MLGSPPLSAILPVPQLQSSSGCQKWGRKLSYCKLATQSPHYLVICDHTKDNFSPCGILLFIVKCHGYHKPTGIVALIYPLVCYTVAHSNPQQCPYWQHPSTKCTTCSPNCCFWRHFDRSMADPQKLPWSLIEHSLIPCAHGDLSPPQKSAHSNCDETDWE